MSSHCSAPFTTRHLAFSRRLSRFLPRDGSSPPPPPPLPTSSFVQSSLPSTPHRRSFPVVAGNRTPIARSTIGTPCWVRLHTAASTPSPAIISVPTQLVRGCGRLRRPRRSRRSPLPHHPPRRPQHEPRRRRRPTYARWRDATQHPAPSKTVVPVQRGVERPVLTAHPLLTSSTNLPVLKPPPDPSYVRSSHRNTSPAIRSPPQTTRPPPAIHYPPGGTPAWLLPSDQDVFRFGGIGRRSCYPADGGITIVTAHEMAAPTSCGSFRSTHRHSLTRPRPDSSLNNQTHHPTVPRDPHRHPYLTPSKQQSTSPTRKPSHTTSCAPPILPIPPKSSMPPSGSG